MPPPTEPPPERWFALLIGIRYLLHEDSEAVLDHTHEDVDRFRQLLIDFGYPSENIKIVADREGDIDPTRVNILDQIGWLVKHAVQDPTRDYKLTFYYAGHGGQEEDPKKREKDGLNEAIIPVDAKFNVTKTSMRGSRDAVTIVAHASCNNGYIIDDELNAALAHPLPDHTILNAYFDCCHSGTALDLQFEYSAEAVPRVYHQTFMQLAPRELQMILSQGKRKKASPAASSWPSQAILEPRQVPLRSQSLPFGGMSLRPPFTCTPGRQLNRGIQRRMTSFSWAWRVFFSRANNRIASELLSDVDITFPASYLPSNRLHTTDEYLHPADQTQNAQTPVIPRAIDALSTGSLGSRFEGEMLEMALQVSEHDRTDDDWQYVAANVMALGACADEQESPDARSLAKALDEIYRSYGGHLTYAELFLCFSRRAKPQIPSLSTSREMTRDRWGLLFTL